MSNIELAWAAGFFDGEGNTHLRKPSKGTKTGTTSVPMLSVGQAEPSTLQRFLGAVGIGAIDGPMRPRNNNRPLWTYRVHGFERTQAVVVRLWPYLSSPKRNQAKDVLIRYLAQPNIRTGRCKRGHWLDGRHQCRACQAEFQRRKRVRLKAERAATGWTPSRYRAQGVAHPAARLNDEAVRVIRWAVAQSPTSATRRQVAVLHSVSVAQINNIVSGRSWSHVQLVGLEA